MRWVKETPYGELSDLTVAVDEIYALRAMLADEAAILEATLDYKTFPKTRRKYAEASIERMRQAARGNIEQREKFDAKRALRTAEAPTELTNDEWAKQHGLKEV